MDTRMPSLYSNKDIFGSDYGRFIAGSCQTFFFEVSLSTSFLITIHRCLSIHFPQRINNIFTRNVMRRKIFVGEVHIQVRMYGNRR
uniref:Uncharacterized protein n=1 Tax=Romanomermis culicivorax TaxID=13658 RepID=A0A915KDT5_ROMCU